MWVVPVIVVPEMVFEPAITPYSVEPEMVFVPAIDPYKVEAVTVFDPVIVPYIVDPEIVFVPAIFPYRFAPEMYPLVFIPNAETYTFVPIDSKFRGFEFTMPMLPRVMREFPGFVNCTVFDVVFPLFTTASNVVAIDDVVMELKRPFASIVNWGTCELDPYVPGFTLVVHERLYALPE
jgi:hypothetical protein